MKPLPMRSRSRAERECATWQWRDGYFCLRCLVCISPPPSAVSLISVCICLPSLFKGFELARATSIIIKSLPTHQASYQRVVYQAKETCSNLVHYLSKGRLLLRWSSYSHGWVKIRFIYGARSLNCAFYSEAWSALLLDCFDLGWLEKNWLVDWRGRSFATVALH